MFYGKIEEKYRIVPSSEFETGAIRIEDNEEDSFLFFHDTEKNVLTKRTEIKYEISELDGGALITFLHTGRVPVMLNIVTSSSTLVQKKVILYMNRIIDDNFEMLRDDPPSLFFKSSVNTQVVLECTCKDYAFSPIVIESVDTIDESYDSVIEEGFNSVEIKTSLFHDESEKVKDLTAQVERITLALEKAGIVIE